TADERVRVRIASDRGEVGAAARERSESLEHHVHHLHGAATHAALHPQHVGPDPVEPHGAATGQVAGDGQAVVGGGAGQVDHTVVDQGHGAVARRPVPRCTHVAIHSLAHADAAVAAH